MKKYLRVLYRLFNISQVHIMEYRADFLFTWFGDVIAAVFTVLLFNVIYAKTGNIAGWSKGEVFLILAATNYFEAFIYFLYVNTSHPKIGLQLVG